MIFQEDTTMTPWYNMPAVSPYTQPGMPNMTAGAMAHPMLYPEVYYKVQPFIIVVCDEMEMMGITSPSEEMMENMTERVSAGVIRMYPEMGKHAQDEETVTPAQFGFDTFGRRRHRRGFLGDFISILLLSELFRRRRR